MRMVMTSVLPIKKVQLYTLLTRDGDWSDPELSRLAVGLPGCNIAELPLGARKYILLLGEHSEEVVREALETLGPDVAPFDHRILDEKEKAGLPFKASI